MTMDGGGGGLVEQRREGIENINKKIGYVVSHGHSHRLIKKKKYKKRIPKSSLPKDPMTLQELFNSCKHVFKGPGTVPSPCDAQKLCTILDNMKPEDVGLSSNLQFFSAKDVVKGTPVVTYTTIYKCNNFELCLFFLPSTGVIPLHNHPGMTVFSKLLLGTMHIKSYDWVNPNDATQSSKVRLARVKADNDFTAPCDTSVLYPTTGGNIHEFTAITTCAVLDVIGPPYSGEDGHDCSHYKDFPYDAFPNGDISNAKEKGETERYGWLEEIGVPENSHMDEIEYLGPQIIDTIN